VSVTRKLYLVWRVFGFADASADRNGTEAFADCAKAEQRREALEAAERRDPGRNPFHFSQRLPDCTRFDEGILRDWVLDLGLTPPDPQSDRIGWEDWWELHADMMSEWQRQKMYEALALVRFFDVVRVDWDGVIPRGPQVWLLFRYRRPPIRFRGSAMRFPRQDQPLEVVSTHRKARQRRAVQFRDPVAIVRIEFVR
jgi:hypothetical protein